MGSAVRVQIEEQLGRAAAGPAVPLLAAGRFPVGGLITHRFAPDAAAEAYGLAAGQREQTMGVLFDWSATAG